MNNDDRVMKRCPFCRSERVVARSVSSYFCQDCKKRFHRPKIGKKNDA